MSDTPIGIGLAAYRGGDTVMFRQVHAIAERLGVEPRVLAGDEAPIIEVFDLLSAIVDRIEALEAQRATTVNISARNNTGTVIGIG